MATADTNLLSQPYYHGLLPREDVKQMLKTNGDFVVRTSEPQPGQPRAYILSVMADEAREEAGIKHFVIQRPGGKYSIERFSFESIPEMIMYHLTNRESVSNAVTILLRSPILRQTWELNNWDVKPTKKVGEGAFGEVSLGTLRVKGGRDLNCAIKQAKLEQCTKEQIKEIMREARLMRAFDHPNVVRCYGVAAGSEPLYIVMELCDGGALNNYLTKEERPVRQKIEFCMQAAYGLEYLHHKEVLHRDVAARNCLLGEGKIKLSDFGMTREGVIYQMDLNRRVPVRWLSADTMRTGLYTQKTDVWAYGVLTWEIFANGAEPYPGMTVAEGYRMSFDGYSCPPDLAALITNKCWADSPNTRSSMTDLIKTFERVTGLTRPPTPATSGGHATPSPHDAYGSGAAAGAASRAHKKKSRDNSKARPKKDNS